MSGELRFSDKGAKILIISVYPMRAAQEIGVVPNLSGVLGFTVKGANILVTSVCPLSSDQ